MTIWVLIIILMVLSILDKAFLLFTTEDWDDINTFYKAIYYGITIIGYFAVMVYAISKVFGV